MTSSFVIAIAGKINYDTAVTQLMIDQMRQNNRQVGSYDPAASVFKKSLGVARPPGTSSSFKPPFATNTTPESTAAYDQAVEYYMQVCVVNYSF